MLSMAGFCRDGQLCLPSCTLSDLALGNDRIASWKVVHRLGNRESATVGRDPVVERHFSLVLGLVLHRCISFVSSTGSRGAVFKVPCSESAQALGVYRYKYRTAD